jgi:hypothetical protein
MPTTKLTGYYDYIPQMPHTHYTRSCTINSLNITSFTLRNYEIQAGTDPNGKRKVADFTVFNPGPGDNYNIRRMPVLDDGLWHACVAGADDPLPWQLVSCDYLLNGEDAIGFRFQWYCDDRDPEHAYVKDCS